MTTDPSTPAPPPGPVEEPASERDAGEPGTAAPAPTPTPTQTRAPSATRPARDPAPSRRLLALVVLLVVAAVARLVTSHAERTRARRIAQDARHRAAARVMGTPDLALSSSSRWLRHPSQTEAGAAFSDGPASPDMDPAGALIAPPGPVLARGAFGGELVRRARAQSSARGARDAGGDASDAGPRRDAGAR